MTKKTKGKSSFRDMMLIIIVVVICFGLTLYGIVYLTDKVFNPDDKIEIQAVNKSVTTTDPEYGDLLTFALEEEDRQAEPATQPTAEQRVETTLPPVVEEPVAPVQKPTPTPQATPKPTPQAVQKPTTVASSPKSGSYLVSNAPSGGNYAIQLLAVPSLSSAEAEAKKFANACSGVHIRKAYLGSKGVWYRVRCGVTNDKASAQSQATSLGNRFKLKPQVVSNN